MRNRNNESYKPSDFFPFFGLTWYSQRNNLDTNEHESPRKPNLRAYTKAKRLQIYNAFIGIPLSIAIGLGMSIGIIKGLESLIK